RTAMQRAIASDRLAHAYLFVGPEGVGKAGFAHEVAKAILCARPRPSDESMGACGDCSSCRTFVSRNHPGFSTLEPAEGSVSIDIARVRETIEALAVRTAERRVMIVDPVDALPPASANAFLKTLEEPPVGVIFLMVTARPAQLLDTIVSRCHRVPFTSLDAASFRAALEAHDVPTDEIEWLHEISSGSPGLALRLRTGIEVCGGREAFESILGGGASERPETLIDLVPPLRSDEPKRERIRRLLELVLDGIRAQRSADPDRRQAQGERAVAIAALAQGLDSNLNPELVLERLARCLRPSVR
ncbi:MAG: DNA polymerase III subunit, partial [Planctomycetes bacterium]|nr:DNA polymerase III subunit [Planctomycetota bacterium]